MALVKHPVYVRLFTSCVAIFWGSWIVIGIIIRFLSSPRKFLYAKEYTKLPDCAYESSLGRRGAVDIDTAVTNWGTLRIKYVSNGEQGKPLVLLLHGFPESWYSWRFQLRELSDQFRVVAVDMRGYGDSDKPQELENYALDYLVEDVPSLIRKLGYEKATVIGHDWGGVITWQFAAKYPEMCEKAIVLNAPHPSVHFKYLTGSIKQFLASWYMFYFLIPYLPEIVMRSNDFAMLAATLRGRKAGVKNRNNLTKEDLDVFKYSIATWEARVASHNYIRANFTYAATIPRGKITVPMLLLWGTEDLFLTKQIAEASVSKAEKCKLVFIEGASHWVQQDKPEEVNQHIKTFLSS